MSKKSDAADAAEAVKASLLGKPILVRISETVQRPGVVVAVWGETCINAQVTLDGSNDLEAMRSRVYQMSGIDPEKATDKQKLVASKEACHICSHGNLWLTSIIQGDEIFNWQLLV